MTHTPPRAPTSGAPPSSAPARRHAALALLAASLVAVGCLDDTTAAAAGGAAAGGALGERGLLVVGGDYQTSVLSRVDVDSEQVVAAGFLHSGSKVGATGTAFSGDVVVGSVEDGSGDAIALDRGRGVVTRLRGLEVRAQFDVATGFFANPQDALAVPGEIWVARGQRAPGAGAVPGDGRGDDVPGDDVLVVDETGKPRTRLALGAEATVAGHLAMAGAGAWDGQRWWLPLASIRDDFQAVGPGRVIAVGRPGGAGDGPLQVLARVDLPSLQNCRALRRGAGVAERAGTGAQAARLVVACSGSFAGTVAAQIAGSGVAVLRGDGSGVERVIPAVEIGQRPLGFALAVTADAALAWVVDLGDLEAQTADRLWQLDLTAGKAKLVRVGSGAFSLVNLWHDDVRSRLWVVDHNDLVGDLGIYDSGPARAAPSMPALLVARRPSNPGGLRALEVGRW